MKTLKNLIILDQEKNIISKVFFALITLLAIALITSYHGDSAIYFIYAKNIAHGDFFSFNPGEFSSGSTSPLWALILSIFYHFPAPELGMKIFASAITLFSLAFFYSVLLKTTKTRLTSLIGLLVLSFFLFIPGVFIYEAPLIVIFLTLIIKYYKHTFLQPDLKKLLILSLSIAILPSIRPDSGIISLTLFIALFFDLKTKKHKLLLTLITLIFALPQISYFIYSYLHLDSTSTSSYCRSFALREGSIKILGFYISTIAFRTFFGIPLLLVLFVWKRIKLINWTNFEKATIVSFMVYFTYFMFVSPITGGYERYLIPIIPLFFVLLKDNIDLVFQNNLNKLQIVVLILLIIVPISANCYESWKFYNRDLYLNKIMEVNLANNLNKVCKDNALILSYEVQNRYYLNNNLRVLSLDGIIDGKVAPYLESGDMTSFLLKYRPNYWIVNDAVEYRPYLKKSILNKVYNKLINPNTSYVELEGIRFTNLFMSLEKRTKGFAGYLFVVKIDYLK